MQVHEGLDCTYWRSTFFILSFVHRLYRWPLQMQNKKTNTKVTMTTKQQQTMCINLKVHSNTNFFSFGQAGGGKNGLSYSHMCELLHGVYSVHSVHDCIIVHSTSTTNILFDEVSVARYCLVSCTFIWHTCHKNQLLRDHDMETGVSTGDKYSLQINLDTVQHRFLQPRFLPSFSLHTCTV